MHKKNRVSKYLFVYTIFGRFEIKINLKNNLSTFLHPACVWQDYFVSTC